jgi:Fe-S cluster assembly ATPase SufC
MILLDSELSILDETDSGLDIDFCRSGARKTHKDTGQLSVT